ncbi:MAG: hypothetical protein ACE5RC_00075 [Nitrosopumilus sp.]
MLTRDNSSEWYYVDGGDKDRDIQELKKNIYNDTITNTQSFWSSADRATRFKAGDQTLYEDYYGNVPAFRRRQLYFNRIRRITNMITGHQRKNRNSIISIPVEDRDQQASDQTTKLLFWTAAKCHEQERISEAFDYGPVTTGMSLLHYWMDYTKDPESGNIMCDHVPYASFMIDNYFKKKDLSDCNFIWRRQFVSPVQAKILLPGREKEIDKMRPKGSTDSKFQYMAETYNYGMKNLFYYDEFYYRDMRDAKILIETDTRLTREWQGTDENLEEFLRAFPNVVVKKTKVPTVRMALSLDDKTFYDGPQLSSSDMPIDLYPFVPFLGYFEPNLNFSYRINGVVDGLIDAQYIYNRRKIIELDILESQVNSGWKYKPGSLVNPADVFLSGQGRGLAIKDGKEMTDVEKIPPGDIPPSFFQLSESMGREMQEISGVNEELLGAATDDKAGILSMLRQGASLTTLQLLFDNLDFSMRLCGELRLELIRKNFSYGKVRQILGEEPVEDYKNKVFNDFDVRIEEGANTTSQRQLAFIQKFELYKAGVPISPEDLLQDATFQKKNEVIENIQKQQQQQLQQAQQQQELEMFKLQSEAELLKSQAIANEGLGIERLSRVEENRALAVEKMSESEQKRNQSKLDYAKTLKELEDIDLNQINNLIKIDLMIKQAMQEEKMLTEENKTQSNPLELLNEQPTDFSNTQGIRGF